MIRPWASIYFVAFESRLLITCSSRAASPSIWSSAPVSETVMAQLEDPANLDLFEDRQARVLAEILMRTWHESQDKTVYEIRETRNIENNFAPVQ